MLNKLFLSKTENRQRLILHLLDQKVHYFPILQTSLICKVHLAYIGLTLFECLNIQLCGEDLGWGYKT